MAEKKLEGAGAPQALTSTTTPTMRVTPKNSDGSDVSFLLEDGETFVTYIEEEVTQALTSAEVGPPLHRAVHLCWNSGNDPTTLTFVVDFN